MANKPQPHKAEYADFSKSFWAKSFLLVFVFCSHFHQAKPEKRFFCLSDNFFEVQKNTFYRSKQLSPNKLLFYLKKFNIKTVINLRGENKNKKWWGQEAETIRKHGAKLHNIAMNANQFPKKQNLLTLLDLYKKAPHPILVHCNGGADRTGEAAALWVLDQQNKRKKDALKQLTFKYGHIRSKTPAKRK
ncbi:tyrosine-protein phosphatase, partial [Candidatus Babeliales bacterium]|nr:tyrosine-protein phosphatase [Candidatus Babeliales bacterium]